jgi:hypothetical protein
MTLFIRLGMNSLFGRSQEALPTEKYCEPTTAVQSALIATLLEAIKRRLTKTTEYSDDGSVNGPMTLEATLDRLFEEELHRVEGTVTEIQVSPELIELGRMLIDLQ